MKHFFWIFLLACPCIFSARSHAQLSIEAQFRNRFEFRDGYKELLPVGELPTYFISQRTRLSVNYQSQNLNFWFTPQDVRIWGSESVTSSTGVFGNSGSLDMFEGYAQLRFGVNNWLSVGRQPFIYDNQRLLADRNWNQYGLRYDALCARFNFADWNLHIAGSWNALGENNQGLTYPPSRIKSLDFIWLNKQITPELNTSFLHIAAGSTPNDTTSQLFFRQTTGVYSQYHNEIFQVTGNIYYQYGNNTSGKPINAYLFDFVANYKTSILKTGCGLSYLSGNSEAGASGAKDHLFNPLYGARHKYFGYMDYFRDFSKHTNEGGLADLFYSLEVSPIKSFSINNTGHFFQLAKTNTLTPSEKYLGYENDLTLSFGLKNNIKLEGGYNFIVPTESLKSIQGISNNKWPHFAYIQLTLKPKLL